MITNIKGIILFGDSVFFGAGASHRNFGCGRLLKKKLNKPVLIKSRNKDTTQDGLLRLRREVINEEAFSHVIVMFGNNDCRLIDIDKAQINLCVYQNNLKKIINEIRSSKKIPFLVNLQPINSDIFLQSLGCKQRNIVVETQQIAKHNPYSWQKSYSDVCSDVAKTELVTFIDIRTPLERDLNEVLAGDGLHPNDMGHQIIAETIYNFLVFYRNKK